MDYSQSYYELFGLTEKFDINQNALAARYQEFQKALHPDKYANASERERRISLQQAAHINSAFQTLKDPLARARYLLELHSIGLSDENKTIRDPEFLEQQMELREELAEIRHADDPMGSLIAFMQRLDLAIKSSIEQLRQHFAEVTDESLAQCQTLVYQLQFLYRLQQETEALEEELL